ncbi:MAG: folylpolyglutamate synthase/dihydrofolate synthase family protein [Bacteroidales bacterium]|jgi:dihydrofolate synthase/folylpolyglutamate synthase|nr:folylpolyglutamate synthase/dihydrofolate synthase family protein [Bacteroidales bacterium]
MNYQDTLEWLFNQLPMYQRDGKAAYKDNLDNTLALDAYFDHPHRKFQSVHVAGTNGKGSVSHMLASVMQEVGYKVGLYTSPHLKDFRERIKINGLMIPEEEVVDFFHQHQRIIEKVKPSFFEMTVALAFDYFAREEIDLAIVEVGMGGRLDSTNIIQPLCSVITNIGFDHTQFLGDTMGKIAGEKAGIIKEKIPVIIGETHPETESVFMDTARKKHSDLCFADQHYFVDYIMQSVDQKQILNIKDAKGNIVFGDLMLDLTGAYQQKNVITALTVLKNLQQQGVMIQENHLYQGLLHVVKNTGLLGRWQILDQVPLTIADTGHNVEGLGYTVKQLNQIPHKQLHIVFGVVNDKNIDQLLKILPPRAIYYFTRAAIPRALDEKVLTEKAKTAGLSGAGYPNVQLALKNAKKNAADNDLIFIGGSTFVVAEVV